MKNRLTLDLTCEICVSRLLFLAIDVAATCLTTTALATLCPRCTMPKPGSIPTRVTVQVDPKLIDASARDTEVTRLPELESAARELRVAFRALHPGTSDPTLRSYVVVDADDPASAEHIAERLRANPAIAAAYVKPPDAMP